MRISQTITADAYDRHRASGVLLLHRLEPPHPEITVTCARRATPNKDAYRLKPEQVMDIARLANLRMWEAYKQRDEARMLERQVVAA